MGQEYTIQESSLNDVSSAIDRLLSRANITSNTSLTVPEGMVEALDLLDPLSLEQVCTYLKNNGYLNMPSQGLDTINFTENTDFDANSSTSLYSKYQNSFVKGSNSFYITKIRIAGGNIIPQDKLEDFPPYNYFQNYANVFLLLTFKHSIGFGWQIAIQEGSSEEDRSSLYKRLLVDGQKKPWKGLTISEIATEKPRSPVLGSIYLKNSKLMINTDNENENWVGISLNSQPSFVGSQFLMNGTEGHTLGDFQTIMDEAENRSFYLTTCRVTSDVNIGIPEGYYFVLILRYENSTITYWQKHDSKIIYIHRKLSRSWNNTFEIFYSPDIQSLTPEIIQEPSDILVSSDKSPQDKQMSFICNIYNPTGQNASYQWQRSDDEGVNWTNSTAGTANQNILKINTFVENRLYRCIITIGQTTLTTRAARIQSVFSESIFNKILSEMPQQKITITSSDETLEKINNISSIITVDNTSLYRTYSYILEIEPDVSNSLKNEIGLPRSSSGTIAFFIFGIKYKRNNIYSVELAIRLTSQVNFGIFYRYKGTQLQTNENWTPFVPIQNNKLIGIYTDSKNDNGLRIVENPQNLSVLRGENGDRVAFRVMISGGTPPYEYKWYYKSPNSENWSVADTINSYSTISSFSSANDSDNAGIEYFCKITDDLGRVVNSTSAQCFRITPAST